MPAVMPIMMGVSAAIGAYQAHKASETAKEAAKTQTDFAQKGMDLQERMYNQQRADVQPWRDAGAQSLGNLSSLLGPGGQLSTPYGRQFNPNLPGGGSLGPPPNQPPPGGPLPAPGMPAPMGGGQGYGAPSPQGAAPQGAPMGAPPPMGGSPMGSGDTVLMQGPDGSTRQIPRAQVAMWQQRGAKVVG